MGKHLTLMKSEHTLTAMENKYLLDEYPLLVLPTLAKLIGLNKAIVLQQVHYWLLKNEQNESATKNGKIWCYQSYTKWQEQFPFWDIQTIRRIILSLEEDKILISANFNKLKIDKTKWYTIDYTKYQNDMTILSKRYHESIKLIVPIQDTNKDTKEVFNKLNTYSESDDSHKNSLKKQMALGDNSNKQKISNKKERRKLSQKDEDKIRNCKFTMKVINFWNSFAPITPQHRFPSLIWKSIHFSLNQLRKGTFYKRHNWTGSYFDLFCDINKITSQQIKDVLDRSFRKKEIIEIIKSLVSYCKEGNFIKKQGYSKTLSLMFYNEESPFVSMFALALIKGGANPVSESIEVKCKYPKLAEKFKKIEDRRMCIDYDKMSVVDKKQFNKVFSKIEERLSSIPKEDNYYNPGLEDFIRAYYDQLQYLNLDKIELIAFSPWSWQWKRVCGSDSGSFNQIKKWLLEEKDIADLERKKEYRRNNPVSDDDHYDN